MFTFLIFSLSWFLVTQAADDSINPTNCTGQVECNNTEPCKDICGCSMLYFYNETTNSCELNMAYLRQGLQEKYNTEDLNEIDNEDKLAKKLRLEADRVFSGIIVSVLIFIACASLCALAACSYCFRVNYSDRKLRKDVQALAEKLQRDGKLVKPKKVSRIFRKMTEGVEDYILLTFILVVMFMAILSCTCCICMRFSDLKMRNYIIQMAKRRGMKVDLEKLDRPVHMTTQPPSADANCTIYVPDVVIVL